MPVIRNPIPFEMLAIRSTGTRPDGMEARKTHLISVRVGEEVHELALRRSGAVRLPPILRSLPGWTVLIREAEAFARQKLGDDIPDPYGTHRRAREAAAGLPASREAPPAPGLAVDAASLATGIPAFQLLAQVGLASSDADARRMIRNGSVQMNDEPVEDEERLVTTADLQSGAVGIRVAGREQMVRVG